MTTRSTEYREIGEDVRCNACKGRAVIYRGRTRIEHARGCPVYIRLHLTYRRFSRTLELYRSTNYN